MPPIDNELVALEIEEKSDSHESEVFDSRERVLETLAMLFENLERGEVSTAHTIKIPELQPSPGRLILSRVPTRIGPSSPIQEPHRLETRDGSEAREAAEPINESSENPRNGNYEARVGKIVTGCCKDPTTVSLDGQCYSPDIDSGLCITTMRHAREQETLREALLYANVNILTRFRYSFDGTKQISQGHTPQDLESAFPDTTKVKDIEIYLVKMALKALAHTREFTTIYTRLNLAPCLEWQVVEKVHHGLSRRIFTRHTEDLEKPLGPKGKGLLTENDDNYYDVWFLLPLVVVEKDVPVHAQRSDYDDYLDRVDRLSVHLPSLSLTLSDDLACFYMKHDMVSRKTKMILTGSIGQVEKFINTCEMGKELDIRSDPFALFSCVLSEIIDLWAQQSSSYFSRLRENERWVISLDNEITLEDAQRAKAVMLELRKLRPFQLRQVASFDCLGRIIKDLIEEHNTARQLLDIPEPTFLRVDKNLRTLLSWADSIKVDQKSRLKMADSCLSTLSYLFSLRHENSIDVNTQSMKKMAESGREESYAMTKIAKATRDDSEAMKKIAFMTMLYLPGAFVATLFSMGIFNFDFDNGKTGSLAVSSQWWIYLIVALPLTVGTFVIFHIMQRRQQMDDDKNARDSEANGRGTNPTTDGPESPPVDTTG